MIDELNKALESYNVKWQKLVAARKDKNFFANLKPTAIAWKVESLAEFDRLFGELRGHCDQIHLAWINERWLVTLHLKSETLGGGISVVKLMQRRPGSSDATGLDHLDFYNPNLSKKILETEPDLKWSEENNGEHCKWLSVWFDGTEAKLRTNTVIDVCIEELAELKKEVES